MANTPTDPPKPVPIPGPSASGLGTSITPDDARETFADPSVVRLHHAPASPPKPGGPIPGYEILSELGRGAMGVVYKARQVKLDRTVALKMMHAWVGVSPEDRQRFHSEAVTVARVQHPNVIQIYDIGEQGGHPYLAAEYVDGGTLADRIGPGRALPIDTVVRLMTQVARGVGAAHSRGVVHRDLKPANILLTADGVPKVADFGLAKQLGADSHTVSGTLLGTPAYMAPEQAMGQVRRVAPQTDVFALGIILYEAVTGELPFKGDTMMETLDRVRTGEPLEMRFRRQGVPPELEVIVHRCLQKAPAHRYPTADALADDLMRVTATPARPKAPEASGVNVYHILTTLAVVGIVAILVWLFAFGGFGRPADTTPTTSPSAPPHIATP